MKCTKFLQVATRFFWLKSGFVKPVVEPLYALSSSLSVALENLLVEVVSTFISSTTTTENVSRHTSSPEKENLESSA